MELQSVEGTQRLELPVSRMTLKSWGGVPREISEKSTYCQNKLGSYGRREGPSKRDIHCAFRKFVMGTGCVPSAT